MGLTPTYFGYKHWTLEDPPRCFNVGKGGSGRAGQKSSRNHKWHAISKHLGLRVEICVKFMCHNHEHGIGEKCQANENARAWEIEQIVAMDTFSTNHSHDDPNDIGCNFTLGGEGLSGWHHSEETIRKIRAGNLGKVCVTKGMPRTDADKRKISQALKGVLKGRKLTPEHVRNRTLAQTGKRRCCRICHVPGHYSTTCPQRRQEL